MRLLIIFNALYRDRRKAFHRGYKAPKKGKSKNMKSLESFGKIDFIHDPLLRSITLLCGDAGIGRAIYPYFGYFNGMDQNFGF